MTTDQRGSWSRRRMLGLAGLAGAPFGLMQAARAFPAFGLGPVADPLSDAPICKVAATDDAAKGPARHVRFAYSGTGICTAAVPVALHRGYFARDNLDVEFLQLAGSTDQILQALATDKADAGSSMLLNWLTPLEQGIDIKLTTGLPGVSPYAINSEGGLRISTNDSYLEPARNRANLDIVGHALVDTITFEGNRLHASGVRVRVTGQFVTPRATREVILCAGAIHSPAILQRSRIGPVALLEKLGIPIRANLPVGENLLDHPIVNALLHLREGSQVSTLMHRHTNCCLRYSSGLAGAGDNDMIMIAGNLARSSKSMVEVTLGRIAVSVYQAFSQGHVRIVTRGRSRSREAHAV